MFFIKFMRAHWRIIILFCMATFHLCSLPDSIIPLPSYFQNQMFVSVEVFTLRVPPSNDDGLEAKRKWKDIAKTGILG